MESYAQKHVKSCLVQNKLDFGSDHRLIQTEMHTPMSRRARKWHKKQKPVQMPDPKSLNNNEIKQLFYPTETLVKIQCSYFSTTDESYQFLGVPV